MIEGKRFIAIILLLLSVCVTFGQQQTIRDNHGRTMEIYIPDAVGGTAASGASNANARCFKTENELTAIAAPIEVEEESVAIARLINRISGSLCLSYGPEVQKHIDKYVKQGRHSTSCLLARASYYNPIFEEALLYYGLPLELKHLPVIESSLNPKAISRQGAAGLWQLMPATGRQYNLQINAFVDERLDPIKSSYAAAQFLADLYKRFGDWSLVLAAYNCGPTRVSNAIEKAGANADFWQIYNFLPRETRGYVPAFIAANYIMNYYCEHNICPMTTDLPAKTDTVVINRDLHFEQIAHVLGLDVDQIAALNPQYRHNIVNGSWKPSALRLPAALITKFIDNEDSIYNYKPDDLTSKRTEVEVNDEEPTIVRYRRVHKSYTSSSKYSSKKGRKKKERKERSKSVTIREGDTLSEIAQRNKISVKKLRRLNGIKGNNIRAGKKIKIK